MTNMQHENKDSSKALGGLLISQKEADILRKLAGKVSELAERPCEQEKRELWKKHNMLQPTRPVIYCDPENGWHEIITPDSYHCETPLARDWEFRLRKELFWGESIKDDKVIESYFNINHVNHDTGWGLPINFHRADEPGSYSWEPPISDYETDLPKLKMPDIIVDYEKTQRQFETADKVFGDLLKVRIQSYWWWSLGMTEMLIYLRGMENVMMDMALNPDGLKAAMQFLSDANMAKLDFLEKNNLLSLNTDFYVGSGGFGYTDELPQKDFNPAHVRAKDMWGFAESQETTSVSAEMFEEFIFPYQKPLLERFGLNCYGCCEPLDRRWHIVKNFPRLRRISVSPWADIDKMAEYLQDKYVMSIKLNPTPLSYPKMDEELVRKSLCESFSKARGCRAEAIMKDTHTIGKNPENVIRWTKIAKEESEKIGD